MVLHSRRCGRSILITSLSRGPRGDAALRCPVSTGCKSSIRRGKRQIVRWRRFGARDSLQRGRGHRRRWPKVQPDGPAKPRSARPSAAAQASQSRSVLQEIAAPWKLSRAQVAGRTGLTKSTVSTLVDALMDARLVVERDPGTRSDRTTRQPALPEPARACWARRRDQRRLHLVVCRRPHRRRPLPKHDRGGQPLAPPRGRATKGGPGRSSHLPQG